MARVVDAAVAIVVTLSFVGCTSNDSKASDAEPLIGSEAAIKTCRDYVAFEASANCRLRHGVQACVTDFDKNAVKCSAEQTTFYACFFASKTLYCGDDGTAKAWDDCTKEGWKLDECIGEADATGNPEVIAYCRDNNTRSIAAGCTPFLPFYECVNHNTKNRRKCPREWADAVACQSSGRAMICGEENVGHIEGCDESSNALSKCFDAPVDGGT